MRGPQPPRGTRLPPPRACREVAAPRLTRSAAPPPTHQRRSPSRRFGVRVFADLGQGTKQTATARDGRRPVLRRQRSVDSGCLVVLAAALELTGVLELRGIILNALRRPHGAVIRARYARDRREQEHESHHRRVNHGRPPVTSRIALFFSASCTSRSSSALL